MTDTIYQPGSKVRVIRSRVTEEVVEGLYLPAFNFHKDNGPRDLASSLKKFLGNVAQEELWVLYLNGGELVALSQNSIGTATAVYFDTNAIVRHVVDLNANEVIVVHARTNSNAEPSEHDARATRLLAEQLALFRCAVLDHMIVTPNKVTQMAQFFPNACSHNTDTDPTERANAGGGPSLPPGMPPELAKVLGKLLGLPNGSVPDPSFPVIDLAVDTSSPEAEEKDIVRLIGEIEEARVKIKERQASGEMPPDGHLTIGSPNGPIAVSDDEDIESLVRDVVVPLQKGEEPRREVPYIKEGTAPGGQPSLAELLRQQGDE